MQNKLWLKKFKVIISAGKTTGGGSASNMSKQLLVLLILSLSSGALSLQKNLKVEFDGTTHKVYLDGEKWFRSSSVLRVRNSGVTWSTEEVDARGLRNDYILREVSPEGEQVTGSDSIGRYSGVK